MSSNLVQSCINSVGYPDFIAGFRDMVERRLGISKELFYCLNTDLFFEDETETTPGRPVKDGHLGNWTAPSWFTEGDISFFYHSRRSLAHSRKIYNKLRSILATRDRSYGGIPDNRRPLSDQLLIVLVATAKRGYEFAQSYNGKIFAIGRACGDFERNSPSTDQHWKSNCYSEYDEVTFLDFPLDYNDFREFISLEQKAITPLTRSQFDRIRNLLLLQNKELSHLRDLQHRDERISDTARTHGWRSVAQGLTRSFLFESQTREYLLDAFISEIADRFSRVHMEVPSFHPLHGGGIIDYVIKFRGKYLPIEAKCSVFKSAELDLQLLKYAGAKVLLGRADAQVCSACLLVDSRNLFAYRKSASGSLELVLVDALIDMSFMSRDAIIRRISEVIYGSD